MNLKKLESYLGSKFVGTGPSFYKKRYLPGRGLTEVEEHWPSVSDSSVECLMILRCLHLP